MSKNQVPNIPCGKCDGSGVITMSDELWQTLLALKRLGEASASGLAIELEFNGHPTALNNRLENLREMGFVTRRRELKEYLYKIRK